MNEIEWVLNDMRYCAPELAAEKMPIWYAKLESVAQAFSVNQGAEAAAEELAKELGYSGERAKFVAYIAKVIRKHSGWRPQEGWVMVPREPTEAMLFRATEMLENWARPRQKGQSPRPPWDTKSPAKLLYKAMLSAAPGEK